MRLRLEIGLARLAGRLSRLAARGGGTTLPGKLLVAVDPGGDPLPASDLPARALLAFGTERHGLDEALLSRADLRVAIPMRKGVSSLNLATAVAVTLYGWRRIG